MLLKPISFMRKAAAAGGFTVTALPLGTDTASNTSVSIDIDISAYGSGDKVFIWFGPEQFISGTATLDGNNMTQEAVTTGNFGGRVTLLSYTLAGAGSATATFSATLAATTNSKVIAPFVVEGGSIIETDFDQGNAPSSLSAEVTPTSADNVIIACTIGLDNTFTDGVTWTNATEQRDAQPVATDSGESYARADDAAQSLQTITATYAAASPQDAGLIVALFEAD